MPTPRKVVTTFALRCGFEQCEQPTGVVAVRVGEPDPADVRGVDDAAEVGQEVPVGQAEPGVDHHRFAGVQHEGVDG